MSNHPSQIKKELKKFKEECPEKFYQSLTLPDTTLKGLKDSGVRDSLTENYFRGACYSLLDIGCNIGADCIRAKLAGARRVVGIDLRRNYIEKAKKLASIVGVDIDFRVCDIAKCTKDDLDTFDVVLFYSIIRHISPHDRKKVFDLLTRVTKNILLWESNNRPDKEGVVWNKEITEKVLKAPPFNSKFKTVKYLGNTGPNKVLFSLLRYPIEEIKGERKRRLENLGYKIRKEIGHGRTGSVYELESGKVIKVTRVWREALAMGIACKNPHKNIVQIDQVFSFSDIPNIYFIVMEKLDQVNLSERTKLIQYVKGKEYNDDRLKELDNARDFLSKFGVEFKCSSWRNIMEKNDMFKCIDIDSGICKKSDLYKFVEKFSNKRR